MSNEAYKWCNKQHLLKMLHKSSKDRQIDVYQVKLQENTANTTTATQTPNKIKVENMTIAMHCNMRPPDAAPVLIRFNYNAHAKFEAAQPICCRRIAFLLLIRYVAL